MLTVMKQAITIEALFKIFLSVSPTVLYYIVTVKLPHREIYARLFARMLRDDHKQMK
jgi:hypothetical protein